MRKRIVSLLAIVAVVALIVGCLTAFVGCDPKGSNESITVWGPVAQQETLKTMAQKFKEANPDITLDIKVGVCAEGDAFSNVSKDPSAAADVFAFANDQLVNFLTIGALAKVGGQFAIDVRNNNTAATVGFAEFDGELYGYPYASDNTYFMYYDKSIITAEQIGTLEDIIATLTEKGKKIGWEIGNGWYDAAWFFAFGGSYKVTYKDDFTEDKVTSTFKDAGVNATAAMRKLCESGTLVNASVDSLLERFGNEATDDLAVGVTGSWNAPTIQKQLGENYAVAQLPTVTVNGQTGRISPFLGGKLYGVNATSKHLTEAHKLAAFLAGEEMQKLRFEKHNIGPSNKNVAALEEVKQDPITNVIAQETEYGVAQMNVPQKFWDPMKAYAQWVTGTDYDASKVATKLDTLAKQIADELPLLDEAKRPYDWHIIGGFTDPVWNTAKFTDATKMTKQEDGTWTIDYTFTEATEYKAIKVYTDAENIELGYAEYKWGADAPEGGNFKIDAAGTYHIVYDPETNTFTATKQ